MSAVELWANVTECLGVPDDRRDRIWRLIERKYSEPHRFYHTMEHLDNMAEEFILLGHTNIESVIAMMFHDAVYNPRLDDNELKSASMSDYIRKMLGLGWISGAIIGNLITATKLHEVHSHHSLKMQGDIATFLDIDLSILGQNKKLYERYMGNVRKEYDFVDQETFNNARAKFILSFLARPSIYFTNHFINKYEEEARKNLQRELNTINSQYHRLEGLD